MNGKAIKGHIWTFYYNEWHQQCLRILYITIQAKCSINRKWFDRFSKGFQLNSCFSSTFHFESSYTLFRCVIISDIEGTKLTFRWTRTWKYTVERLEFMNRTLCDTELQWWRWWKANFMITVVIVITMARVVKIKYPVWNAAMMTKQISWQV